MRKVVTKRGEITVNRTFHPIMVARVYTNSYQKEGTKTAELKQLVETESLYPTKTVGSNLSENVFDTKDFGFAQNSYANSATRVTWMDVPASVSEQEVADRISQFKEATIQQILSNHPILSDKQTYAVENGITTKEVIAESQVMRYPESSEDAEKLILDKLGRPIYRGLYFRTEAIEDVDTRNEDASDFYVTPQIKAEMLEGVTGMPATAEEQAIFPNTK